VGVGREKRVSKKPKNVLVRVFFEGEKLAA